MLRLSLRRLGIRTALGLGAAITCGIWLFAGYYFLNRLDKIERDTAAVQARYTQAQDLFSTIRAQILLGSIYVRDFLLDPASTVDAYRLQLDESLRLVDQALDQYVPVLDSAAEGDRLARLKRETDDFRATMLEVMSAGMSHRAEDARLLLRTRVVPKRQAVIRLSEDVQALNRTAFLEQQRAVTEIYSVSQRRLWQTLGVALVTSLIVGLLVAFHAGRLETHLQLERQKAAGNAEELQHLSAKLITVQEEERRAIARELHDEVGQVLTAVKVEIAVAQRAIQSTGGDAHPLAEARTIIEGALTAVRDLSHVLHPALLDDFGLPTAVEFYLRGFSRRYGIRAEVLHERMEERLAREVEASAYRIIQEALTNVAKHSRATSCRVYLQRLPATVLITVEDDGVGFDEKAVQGNAREGLGLISIRERAIQLGGTVRVESGNGRGVRVTVELPARPRPSYGAEAIGLNAPAASGSVLDV